MTVGPIPCPVRCPTGMEAQKLQLVVRNCVQKALELVLRARVPLGRGTPNHWFNLESEEVACVRDRLEGWKQRISQPLQLDIFIDTSSSAVRAAVGAQPNEPHLVLLERWTLRYEPAPHAPEAIGWPTFYKRFMVLLRSLAAFLRLMPAHRLASSLGRLGHASDAPALGFRVCIGRSSEASPEAAPLDFAAGVSPQQHAFSPPDSTHGKLRIAVSYRPPSLFTRTARPAAAAVRCTSERMSAALIANYLPTEGARQLPAVATLDEAALGADGSNLRFGLLPRPASAPHAPSPPVPVVPPPSSAGPLARHSPAEGGPGSPFTLAELSGGSCLALEAETPSRCLPTRACENTHSAALAPLVLPALASLVLTRRYQHSAHAALPKAGVFSS